MSELIRAANIKRMFRSGDEEFWALGGVSISVKKGGLTILKGRSGSGKTTLVNIIGALDHPTEGDVLFEGRSIVKLPEPERDAFRRQQAGFVFQSVALVSMMTAYENVEFGMRVAGCPKNTIRQRAERCLELVELKGRMNHMAQELSGGEQQRVAIARAVAHSPKIIFADEPTAELDTNTGYAVMRLFRELIEKEGMTIVMTTHDPALMELADALYELEGGLIVGK